MSKKLEDLVVYCEEDPVETLQLSDCTFDEQALVEMDLYDGFKSFIYVSKTDAAKIRDWFVAFCEKYSMK